MSAVGWGRPEVLLPWRTPSAPLSRYPPAETRGSATLPTRGRGSAQPRHRWATPFSLMGEGGAQRETDEGEAPRTDRPACGEEKT